LRIITDEEVRSVLNLKDAIGCLEEALRQYSTGQARNLPRYTIESATGIYRVMSASIPRMNVVGSKQGFWVSEHRAEKIKVMSSEIISLYDFTSGEILALITSHYLNQIRTGAIGAISIKHMSNADASTLGIIGAGLHARTQLIAACLVRNIDLIKVYSRNPANREQFCRDISRELGVKIMAAATPEEAVEKSDIVIEATTSRLPVFDGTKLAEGSHVVSIASGYRGARQLDDEAIKRFSVIAVDSKEQVKVDGTGDILDPISKGIIDWSKVVELGDILTSKAPGRVDRAQITYFKSCGMALFDIAVGKMVLDRLSG